VIAVPRPMVSTGILEDGVQSHGRSLLVWPDRLDHAGARLLRRLVPLGVRIVVFGPPTTAGALPVWPGQPLTCSHAVYWRRPRAGRLTDVDGGCFDSDLCPTEIQALHRAGGVTPLPASVLRDNGGWRHAVVVDGDVPVAVASAQQLAWPLPGSGRGPARLVSAVAVAGSRRRLGLGRSVVENVAADADAAFALVAAAEGPARVFFESLGWERGNVAATYARWE
jgi:hypothetical protein